MASGRHQFVTSSSAVFERPFDDLLPLLGGQSLDRDWQTGLTHE